jgi:carbamoyl-phosphate synthase/aspartate carbamoyltransferase/dihydroorotase
MMLKLPGFIDPHVHMREPGAIHKEDWESGTRAALAGGFTAVLAMPNTQPPITDEASLLQSLDAAAGKAVCDYAQFLGAGPDNAAAASSLAGRTAGLKMYLDQTYGPLRLDDMTLWLEHLSHWPADSPVVAHAEGRSIAAVILLASLAGRSVHIAHVARREEIEIIRAAKEKGLPVTCEVGPHHLFLSTQDLERLSGGRGEVRPRIAAPDDVQALWENLDVIDCFATDHAPHTSAEKDGQNPPPGFPGLETALPLLLTAVHQDRLSLDDVIDRCYHHPRRIFHLTEQPDTWIEVDPDDAYQISAANMHSRAAWTPFEGMPVRGRVQRVILRGQTVYENERVLALPGSGRNIRS